MNIGGYMAVPGIKRNVSPGCFGRHCGNSVSWYTCRETFHRHSVVHNNHYYFYSHDSESANIADFISKIENHLDVERSCFKYTNNEKAVWVEPSNWWIRQDIRHCFFTLALRAGLGWRQHFTDWRATLWLYPYVKQTSAACDKFLRGYTGCDNRCGLPKDRRNDFRFAVTEYGWVNLLSKDTNRLIFADDDRQRRTEKLAYIKWEQSGKPDNRSHEFWNQAAYEVNSAFPG